MKIWTFVKIFLISQFLFLLISPLRSGFFGGFPVSSLIGFMAFFYLTYFLVRRYESKLPSWWVLVAVLLGKWLLEGAVRIIDFEGSIVSLPDSILHSLGIFAGIVYSQTKSPVNYAAFTLLCLAPVFMCFQGYDYWLQKLNFGTFTGNVSYAQPAKFEGLSKDGVLIADREFDNKIVLLDFWNTTCGICFTKFPHLQALYDKYQNDPLVMIIAVNAPLEGDRPGQAFRMIEDRGYTFPVVIAKEELPEKFGIFTYPRTFIIADKGTVVFYGDVRFAGSKIEELRSSLR